MDFKYLSETKNEFHEGLYNILVPHLYEGIVGLYQYSIDTCNKLNKHMIANNPGVINIFKMCLTNVSSINNHEIENEYLKIKEKSGCSSWFDNLIKACFKSYALFLTWDPSTNTSKYISNTLYDNISLKDFIHKCYIESCEYFKHNPEIFTNKILKSEIFNILRNCIEMTMKKILPYDEIIQEYLNINYSILNNNDRKDINDIKKQVDLMMNYSKYGKKIPEGIFKIKKYSDDEREFGPGPELELEHEHEHEHEHEPDLRQVRDEKVATIKSEINKNKFETNEFINNETYHKKTQIVDEKTSEYDNIYEIQNSKEFTKLNNDANVKNVQATEYREIPIDEPNNSTSYHPLSRIDIKRNELNNIGLSDKGHDNIVVNELEEHVAIESKPSNKISILSSGNHLINSKHNNAVEKYFSELLST